MSRRRREGSRRSPSRPPPPVSYVCLSFLVDIGKDAVLDSSGKHDQPRIRPHRSRKRATSPHVERRAVPVAGELVAFERQRTTVVHANVEEGARLAVEEHHEHLPPQKIGGHGASLRDVAHLGLRVFYRSLL